MRTYQLFGMHSTCLALTVHVEMEKDGCSYPFYWRVAKAPLKWIPVTILRVKCYKCLLCSLYTILQISAIRAKYDKLETELKEKRDKTHTQIQEFMDNKLGVVLSDLRRELKLTEARLRDNHQVCGTSFQRLNWQVIYEMASHSARSTSGDVSAFKRSDLSFTNDEHEVVFCTVIMV